MIVSPHIDAAGTREVSPSVSGPRSVFGSKTDKKEASGLFAKLLAGLTRNLTSRKTAGTPAETLAGTPAGAEAPGESGFDAGLFAGEVPAGKAAGKRGDPFLRRGRAAGGEIPEQAFLAAFRPETAAGQVPFERGAGEAEPRSENIPAGRLLRKQPAEGDRRLKETPAEEGGFSPVEAFSPPAAGDPPPEEAEFGAAEAPGVDGLKPAKPEPAVSGHVPVPPKAAAGEGPVPGRDFGFTVPPASPASAAPPGSEPAERRGVGAKSADRRRDRAHIEVRDLRSAAEREQRPAPALSGVDTGVSLREAAAEGETELVVELRGGSRDMASAENFREARGPRYAPSFENLLARELNQSLSGDIVRHAQAVLRDGNAGTIRLSLRPETLGNVKIRLEMAENKIAGHIIVESEEALRAFEREIRSLEQAFRDAGFEAADLEMSLNQGGGSEQRWNGEETAPLFSAGLAASRYAREQEEAPAGEARGLYVSGGHVTVNMLI